MAIAEPPVRSDSRAPMVAPVLPLTSRQILMGAIDFLDEHGWTQKQARDEDGRACLTAAVRAWWVEHLPRDKDVPTLHIRHQRALNIAYGRIQSLIPDDETPEAWNDDPGRTIYEVKDLLRYASKET